MGYPIIVAICGTALVTLAGSIACQVENEQALSTLQSADAAGRATAIRHFADHPSLSAFKALVQVQAADGQRDPELESAIIRNAQFLIHQPLFPAGSIRDDLLWAATRSDVGVVPSVLVMLMALEDRKIVPTLSPTEGVRLLASSDSGSVLGGVWALFRAASGGAISIDELGRSYCSRFASVSAEARSLIIWAGIRADMTAQLVLGHEESAWARSLIAQGVTSMSIEVRASAIKALVAMRTPYSSRMLAHATADESAIVREEAITALANQAERGSIAGGGPVCRALENYCVTEGAENSETPRAISVLGVIARDGVDAAVQSLERLLDEPSPLVRDLALIQISSLEYPSERASAVLATRLQVADSEGEMRLSVEGLARQGYGPALAELWKRLAGVDSAAKQASIVRLIGLFGESVGSGWRDLVVFASSDTAELREAAVCAIAQTVPLTLKDFSALAVLDLEGMRLSGRYPAAAAATILVVLERNSAGRPVEPDLIVDVGLNIAPPTPTWLAERSLEVLLVLSREGLPDSIKSTLEREVLKLLASDYALNGNLLHLAHDVSSLLGPTSDKR